MTPRELDYSLAVEDEFGNVAMALWCLSTASLPYWPDLPRMFDMTGPAVCRAHLTEPARCKRCGGGEGYYLADGERITLRGGRCQVCDGVGEQLMLFEGAA